MDARTFGSPSPTDAGPRPQGTFAEVIVNVPIRRAFSRGQAPPTPDPLDPDGRGGSANGHQLAGGAAHFQTFHYHLPPDLVGKLRPGHLVWVPFGNQRIQGIVVGLTREAPLQTRAIDRLARTEPVLNQAQLDLAFWIADYYVAPLSESVKLFLPPGLLRKNEDRPRVRAKREEQIELLIGEEEIRPALLRLGRRTKQVCVLESLLAAPDGSLAVDEVAKRCGLRSDSTFATLAEKGLLTRAGSRVRLAQSTAESEAALLALRGADRYEPLLRALAEMGGPVWKTDLYARVDGDRSALLDLQRAGLIRMDERTRYRDPLAGRIYPRTRPPSLTEQQQTVWDAIHGAVFAPAEQNGHGAGIHPHAFLLHGATGSGKTEIYLRAIAETLARGRQAIVLVPEIALTPQTVAHFAGRFPNRVSVIHSDLNSGERYDVWQRIRAGEIDVVVGPRSALFAPMARLGLIIIDEEHESSYKQDSEEWGSFTVFYDARTIARRLADLTASPLILGSATPSLETYHQAQQGEMSLLEMPQRVMGHGAGEAGGEDAVRPIPYAELPPVEIVDMRQELRGGNRSIFSRSLQAELHATLDAREQAILFLNRRGTNTFVLCRDCGHVEECAQCEVPLTYHERASVLICHHCNQRQAIPTVCPECGSRRIKYFGSGTQRIEELVGQISPRARILRWDADTTRRKGSHEAILERFAAHEADVLVGTQMIAKGLDLPLVTLVGVISADVGLYLPDFRSAERTFQLLTQVAGRAGRSARGGRVIFQSYTPEHYAVQAAAEHDYQAFYRRAMAFRREQGYPPVSRLARLIFWHKRLDVAEARTEEMAALLRQRAQEADFPHLDVEIHGPAPAFFARYRSFYRWQVLVRARDPSAFLRGLDIPFGWRIDIDPISLL